MKLDGRVAIVTGGAMGNGFGVVKAFLRYGAKVIVIDYSNKLADSLHSLDNPNLIGYQADLRDKKIFLNLEMFLADYKPNEEIVLIFIVILLMLLFI